MVRSSENGELTERELMWLVGMCQDLRGEARLELATWKQMGSHENQDVRAFHIGLTRTRVEQANALRHALTLLNVRGIGLPLVFDEKAETLTCAC